MFQSPWNEAILDGVADTFQDAVLQFCKHPSLRFQWMGYLPSKNTISEQFWAKLLPRIVTRLKNAPIMLSWSEKYWKLPHQLKWLLPSCQDDDGEPLFEDLPNELYLSPGYKPCKYSDFDTLGIQNVTVDDLIERVRADLSKPNSKMKSPTTKESWHSRSADMLLLPFKNKWTIQKEVRGLPLIPLHDGSWVSGDVGSIFYPENAGVPVPTDIGVRLVDQEALNVTSRHSLFSELGVRDCKPPVVIRSIVGRYNRWNAVDLTHSIEHLRYLYWHIPESQKSLDKSIYLKDQEGAPVYRTFVTLGRDDLIVDDLYLESDEEYGAKRLLMQIKDGDKILAPQFPAHFLHVGYLKAVSPEARRYDLSWTDWLQTFAEVQSIPRLASSRYPTKLSNVFLHIAKHRGDRLVGALAAHWPSYNTSMTDEIAQTLSKACVTCENVGDRPLKQTYMPMPKLKKRCNELGIQGGIPFLELPHELRQEPPEKWDFLKRFSVGHKANLDFYIDILVYMARVGQIFGENSRAIYVTVYEEIEKHSKVEDYARVRSVRS